MTSVIHKLSNFAFEWLYKSSIVARFEGIPLVSWTEFDDDFVRVISRALELIRDQDPRRYTRVKKHTRWLVNRDHPSGARSGLYQHQIKAVSVDFELDLSMGGELFHAAHYASVIVHEATHGVIRDRGIVTTTENRVQVERICRAEENRFLKVLIREFPSLPYSLIRPFDPENWRESWEMGRFASCFSEFKRAEARSKKQSRRKPL